MEEIKAPKKERKFLKAMGDVALTLFRELLLGVGKKVINKVGNKRQGLVIAFALVAGISYASIDSIPYPVTGNKQRLGWQTSGNGLVWRGTAADTVTKPTSYADKNVKAYLILDSVSGSLYVFKQGAWAAITGAGGGLTMPFDSITFNTAKDGTVGVGEVEYNDTQGSLIQGLKGGNVTNVIGQQLHQRVNNRTGATLNKGDVVYLSGSQGNRITVAKAIATSDPTSANTFGIVAESIADNQSGYVITEGLITNLNTSALTADSAVYLSGTTAGALTSTKPQAPIHGVYIGVCVKSNAGSGEVFVKIRNGQELDELHDVQITSPVDRASLYYKSSDGLWRDTTAALLVSDTASMLANYATKAYADTTGRFYARQEFRNVSSSTLTWTQSDTLVVNDTTSLQVYRNGQILLPNQYTVPTKTTVVIAATSFKLGENYTVIFPRGGGGGGSGSGSLTSISGGTGITVSPNPITTTGTVSADLTVMMELTDTTLLNLTTRFATKQNNITLTTTGTSGASTLVGSTLNIPQYSGGGTGTVTSVASGYGLLGGPITTTGTLTVDTSTVYDFVRDSIVAVEIGGDTIKILKQEYAPATTDTLTWTVTSKFPIQLRQFILLFRNGQLLLNDQFTVIDTNKVKVAASSFKIGENYTLVTVSGIGSVSSAQSNPIYPEAGIALSTGTTWTTSITNNSSNWNTAFTDRLKWDGGSTGLVAATGRTSLGGTTIGQSMFTLTNPSAITFPRFNADNTVDARSAVNFRSDIGAGTVTSVTASGTAGNPISITNTTTTPTLELLSATTGRNGYLTSTDWTTFNGKQNTITLTTTGTSGASTLVGSTLNIPQYTAGVGTVTSVSGTGAISVATGTTTPVISVADAAFGTAGIVTSSGSQQFSGDKVFEGITQFNARAVFKDYTYTATRLAGLSSTDRFATVTIGTGLSLASGTLSATGGGVTSVTASTPLSSSGGTTPNITITDAGAAASGVVNTTTQSFAGNKTFTGNVDISTGTLNVGSTGTFGGRVKTNWLERNYAYSTSSSFTVSVNTTWQDINTSVLTTLTLPNAATYPGKELHLRQTGTGNLQSASSNIIPFNTPPTGSTSTGILTASTYEAVTLVSDGTNWIIMQRSEN